MNIQSLSICVPAKTCINKCEFCVSRMYNDLYPDNITENNSMRDLYIKDYVKRLEFARDNGCQTIMLTGQAEPQQNRSFLEKFAMMNNMLKSPFKNIEMQTTGAGLNEEYLIFLRNFVGVTTISLSISSFDDVLNNEIIHTLPSNTIILNDLCKLIKKYDFNLRLSLNITSLLMDSKWPNFRDIFRTCSKMGADQVTFRKMYFTQDETIQDIWVKKHQLSSDWFSDLNEYIVDHGKFIDILEYGNKRFSIYNMSVVVDEDCMAKAEDKQSLKYIILRPNCKLYSKWDDKGSLIF